MEHLVVCAVAVIVSGLTLFSGFGLGTVLMPAFALFFPVPVAVAATAVLHLANNLFKAGLVGRKADRSVVLRFAVPGAAAAIFGGLLLNYFASVPPVFSYQLGGKTHEISWVGLAIGVLIIAFAFLDLLPRFEKLSFDRKYLCIGGDYSQDNPKSHRSGFAVLTYKDGKLIMPELVMVVDEEKGIVEFRGDRFAV